MTHTDCTTHPEYRALLKAVIAAPADDLPRLVYADWLEEHGQLERAEFIRVGCELAKLRPVIDWGERENSLRRRERELWDGGLYTVYRKEVPEGVYVLLSGWTSGNVVEAHPRRGFIAEVRCRLVDWIGGECGQCHGWQSPHAGENGWVESDCPACSGTGRTTGIGPRLVREQPVEVVRVVDREPWTDGTEQVAPTEYDFAWWREAEWEGRGDEQNSRGNLPDAVFDLLGELYPDNRLIWSGPRSNQHIGFPTRDAANLALSAALIRWASEDRRE